MEFFDYFDPCKTTDINTTDVGVPFSTEPHPFCFDDAGMPSCSDDSPFGPNSFDTDSSYSDTFDYGSSNDSSYDSNSFGSDPFGSDDF